MKDWKKEFRRIFKGTVMWQEHESFIQSLLDSQRTEKLGMAEELPDYQQFEDYGNTERE